MYRILEFVQRQFFERNVRYNGLWQLFLRHSRCIWFDRSCHCGLERF